MQISKNRSDKEITVKVSGRLDTSTAPELESALKNEFEGLEALYLDFSELEYLSSAGLRVLLASQKIMNKQGKMVVKNINTTIREIFDITGFSDILTIE